MADSQRVRVKTRSKAFFFEEILIKNPSENLPKLSKQRMQYFCHALKLNFKEPTLSRKCKPLFDDSQVARTKDDYKFSTAKDPLFNSTGFCKVEDHCRQEHRCDCRKSEVRSGKWEMGGQKSKHGSKKWEVGGQKSKHAALSLNGQKSEIRSSNFVKSEV